MLIALSLIALVFLFIPGAISLALTEHGEANKANMIYTGIVGALLVALGTYAFGSLFLMLVVFFFASLLNI